MTGKVFEYLSLGKAILVDGIVSGSELYNLINSNGNITMLDNFHELLENHYSGCFQTLKHFRQLPESKAKLLELYNS